MSPIDLTTELLRQIRDGVHRNGERIDQLEIRFSARFDDVDARFERMDRRIDRTRTELLEAIEDNGRRIEDNGRRIEDNGRRIDDNGRRITHLEEAVLQLIGHTGSLADRVTVLEGDDP